MKTKDKKELFTKTTDELKKLLNDAKKSVSGLKLNHQQNKLKNTRSIFNKGKEIAVLHSIINLKKTMSSVAEAVDDKKEVIEKVVKKTLKKGGKK